MKKRMIIFLFSCLASCLSLSKVAGQGAPDFTTQDAESLRQYLVNSNYGKALTAKQLKQFERVNQIVSEKGKLPINQIDDEILLGWIQRQYGFAFEQYQQNQEGADKYLWLMKRLYKSDSTIIDRVEPYYFQSKDELKKLIK